MHTDAVSSRRAQRPARPLPWLLMLLSLSPLLSGCGGCKKDPAQVTEQEKKKELEEQLKKLEEERKKKEKPKPEFEIGKIFTQPNALERIESSFKPGHWSSATVEVIANRDDFRGELVTDPIELDNMPYRLGTSRPALLAKGQKKYLELTLYLPPGRRGLNINTRLLDRGAREILYASQPTVRLPDHQFYFFVLSRDPDRYGFIDELYSVKPPTSEMSSGLGDHYYRILLPRINNRTPLPSNPLCWTSIAYVLWDDLPPTVLSPEQQRALVDWLHWGGQLMVSGPGSLDLLRGSFLEPYLPASGGEALEMTAETLAEFNRQWTVKPAELKPTRPWSGQKLLPHAQATVLVRGGGEPLLAERRIGRGRVVVSAFRLNQRELAQWKSFDGFFNACLLRRAPRRFFVNNYEVAVGWAEGLPSFKAPRQVSSLRYFSRDTDLPLHEIEQLYGLGPQQLAANEASNLDTLRNLYEEAARQWNQQDEPAQIGPGVAGWTDSNAVSHLARKSLTGGIVIPEASFVVWVLGVYLVVLVPLNWAMFRSLGHVEWAWAAAPVITIGFAVAVVKLAQLDVGFVRTKSEVGIVEVQGNYPRAHMTRYTSLYTSLGTTYDLRFEDPTALVQPFPTLSRQLAGQSVSTVNFRRDPGGETADGKPATIGLDGFHVRSNSQAMLHSEHMLDLGGGFDVKPQPDGKLQVINNSNLDLKGAGVLGPDGVAWIGTLEAGDDVIVELQRPPGWSDELRVDLDPVGEEGEEAAPSAQLQTQPPPRRMPGMFPPGSSGFPTETTDLVVDPSVFAADRAASIDDLWDSHWEAEEPTASDPPPHVLRLRHLVHLAQHTREPGELRLVAWTDTEIPGLSIEPAASQARYGNVIIAHLRHAPQRPPRRDASVPPDRKALEPDGEDFSRPESPEEPLPR
jgi:hypothetical protein